MTTAIILAAGTGTRLLPHTETMPKCLIAVGGQSLLERHLRALSRIEGCSEVVVVAGYLVEQVEAELDRLAPEVPRPQVLYNPFFAVTNALFSLWLALQREPSSFIVLNADTMMQRQTIRDVIEALDDHDAVLAVDTRAPLRTDSIRVALTAGLVTEAGKHVLSETASAQSVGVAGLTRGGAVEARRLAGELMRSPTGTSDHWHAVVDGLAGRLPVRALDCSGCAWLEIDTADDLRSAQHLADLIAGG